MKKKMNRHLFPVIDRAIQYRFLAITIIFSAIIIILLAIPMFVPDFIAMGDEELSPELRGAAATRILTIHARVWPPAILVICVLSLYSLRIINRLVGPLFRFRWAFSKLGKGELNFRLKLRSKDYLDREADMFNKMMEMFVDKLGNMQSTGQDAVKSLDELEKFVVEKFGEQEEIQQLLQKHAQHLDNLNQQAGYFQLSAEEKLEQETSGKAR